MISKIAIWVLNINKKFHVNPLNSYFILTKSAAGTNDPWCGRHGYPESFCDKIHFQKQGFIWGIRTLSGLFLRFQVNTDLFTDVSKTRGLQQSVYQVRQDRSFPTFVRRLYNQPAGSRCWDSEKDWERWGCHRHKCTPAAHRTFSGDGWLLSPAEENKSHTRTHGINVTVPWTDQCIQR